MCYLICGIDEKNFLLTNKKVKINNQISRYYFSSLKKLMKTIDM